jgi:hypothetical protein
MFLIHLQSVMELRSGGTAPHICNPALTVCPWAENDLCIKWLQILYAQILLY